MPSGNVARGDAGPSAPLDAGTGEGSPARPLDASSAVLPGEPVDAASPQQGSDAQIVSASCGACQAHEVCDLLTQRCVDRYQPWQLDCAQLPGGGSCQGGPREVLLVAQSQGAIAMFDPQDGLFLGFFTRQQLAGEHKFAQATQGPDQCVYLADTESDKLQRWTPNGSYRDELDLPGDSATHSITFSEDRLYVASGKQIRRFTLAGQLDADLGLQGSHVLVGRDGSLLVRRQDALVEWKADVERTVLNDFEMHSFSTGDDRGPGQVSYVGAGNALVPQFGDAKLSLVELETGAAKNEELDGIYPFGVAQLGNGERLLTGLGTTVTVAKPGGINDSGVPAFSEYSNQDATFSYVGRACLPEAFVEAQKPDPRITDCSHPTGPRLLGVDFESGGLTDWSVSYDSEEWAVAKTTDSAAASTSALLVRGEGALRHELGTVRPSFLSFRVNIADYGADNFAPLISLRDTQGTALIRVASYDIARAHEWTEGQLRDIDWEHGSFDIYRVVAGGCERIADDVPFASATGPLTLEVRGDTVGEAYVDDIELQ